MMYFSPTGSISNLVERMCKGRDLRGVISRTAIQGAGELSCQLRLLWLLPPCLPSRSLHMVPITCQAQCLEVRENVV